MPAKITCVARGGSDLDAAFTNLDEERVQFVLLKFPVGSGTFKRNKFVYVHYIGPKCGIVKRGKWNAELSNVLNLFGTSAGIETNEKETLNFEFLVKSLQKVFVTDSGTFSVNAIREEFNKRMEEEKAKLASVDGAADGFDGANPDDEEPTSPVRKRKLAVELGLKSDSVLKALHEDMGVLNWCVYDPPTPKEPKGTLVEGGSNGLFELVENLNDDRIHFGLVRVGFGVGRFRRTKIIFFHWLGDKVGIVKKSKSNEQYADMMAALGPCNADIKLNGSEDCSIDAILEKVQRVFVIDKDIKLEKTEKAKEKENAFSQDAYLESLLEEQEKVREFYNEPENLPSSPAGSPKKKAGPQDHDVEETLKLLRADEGGLLWGIFQPA